MSRSLTVMQIAGMKLETDSAPPVQRHSALTPSAALAEGPLPKLVTAALRQSAPVIKVPCHDLTLEQLPENRA